MSFRFEPLGPRGVSDGAFWGTGLVSVVVSVPEAAANATGGPFSVAAQWREAVERAEKGVAVTALNQVFKDAGTVVVSQYTGLTVADMTSLRGKMRAAGGGVKVAKNRLVKLALQGTDAVHIADLFKGPTVIAYSSDPVAAAKVSVEFAKTNDKLVILGGAFGKTNLNPEGVKALAAMPSLDELRAKLVGMIQTPATRIAGVVAAPAGQIARVIGAHARQSEAA